MKIGCYGKLPAHGDFILREIPQSFVDGWDNWLQHALVSTQQQLSDQWLNYYMETPIWRFALSQGAIDEHQWVGIVFPSVDKVGRYFPFAIVAELPLTRQPCEFLHSCDHWFTCLEELACQAIEKKMTVEELEPLLISSFAEPTPLFSVSDNELSSRNWVVTEQFSETIGDQWAQFMHPLLLFRFRTYSLWRVGSSTASGPLLVSQSMPGAHSVNAMFDGQWRRWGWQSPIHCLEEKGLDTQGVSEIGLGDEHGNQTLDDVGSESTKNSDVVRSTAPPKTSNPIGDLGISDHFNPVSFSNSSTTSEAVESVKIDTELSDELDPSTLDSYANVAPNSVAPLDTNNHTVQDLSLDDLGIEDHFDANKHLHEDR